jgi:NADPH-dependent glutamate synthase beta subunit-like oxidoreductase
MAQLKVVKKKKGLRLTGPASGASVGGSDLRPKFVPKMPPCIKACPIGNPIREYIVKFRTGTPIEDVWRMIVDCNPLPAVTGRVCPHPCESDCNRSQLDGAVGINDIERYIGTYALEHNFKHTKLTEETQPEKVAVVGSGPAGISFAFQMVRRGYPVTVFEARDKPGGMLRWGIPRYRLPAETIDAEYKAIADLGVEIKYSTKVGKDISFEDLQKQYKVIYLAVGAQKGIKLNIPGEDAPNVMTGVGFLDEIARGNQVTVGKHVVVIGGGNTAIDAARASRRLGADVTILYRRTVKEMPAIESEIEEAREEGVKMEFLAAPVEIIKESDAAKAMKCIRMELKEADKSGRPRPVPIEGSEFTLECSFIIPAISQAVDFEGLEKFKNDRGWITVNEDFRTTTDNVFAGGDVTAELGLAAEAIGAGKKAASAVDDFLRGREKKKEEALPLVTKDRILFDFYEKAPKVQKSFLPPDERIGHWREVTGTITEEQVMAEAKRCMSCGACFKCDRCWMYCQYSCVIKPTSEEDVYKFKLEFCNGCKKCSEQCPCGFVDMI